MEGNETNETPNKSLPTGKRLKGQPVWVNLEQYERLRALAAKDGQSLAAHARRAVDAYLRREEKRGQTLEVRA
jgi:hypothetical protein